MTSWLVGGLRKLSRWSAGALLVSDSASAARFVVEAIAATVATVFAVRVATGEWRFAGLSIGSHWRSN